MTFCYFCIVEYVFVNIHTHRRTGGGIEVVSAMALSGTLPGKPCSVGIHPWQVATATAIYRGTSQFVDSSRHFTPLSAPRTMELADLTTALREVETADVSAIGEIGLDYARPIPHTLQAQVFEAQLKIAQQRGLPVILHCVRAFEPVMEILAGYTFPAVIFHGFVGSRQQAARAVGAGYYLSFGERGLASPKTVEAMKSVPLSRMFFETDESDLSIAEIYRLAAALRGIGVDELKSTVYDNYTRIFGA